MSAGLFISFEGIDGCGKSTQLAMLAAWLRDRGIEPVQLREPGGTVLGEQLRAVLLDPATGAIAGSAEALLYAASRAQLIEEVVRPALRAGRVVLADRYVDSSLAYQGAGRGLGVDEVFAANRLAIGDVLPDQTLYVRVDPQLSAQRRAAHLDDDDRIEAAGDAFFQTVAAAYDELARRHPARISTIDGARAREQVFSDIVAAVAPLVQPLLNAQVRA